MAKSEVSLLSTELYFKKCFIIFLDVLQFSWGHTTESMCIGFMSGTHKDPTAVISKMDNPERSGFVSHVQALRINS